MLLCDTRNHTLYSIKSDAYLHTAPQGVPQLDSEPPSFAGDREPRHRWLLLLLPPLLPPSPPLWCDGLLMQQLLLLLLILESASALRCGRLKCVEKRRRRRRFSADASGTSKGASKRA